MLKLSIGYGLLLRTGRIDLDGFVDFVIRLRGTVQRGHDCSFSFGLFD